MDDQIDSNTLVSVSTTFRPTARHHPLPPDLTLLSSDSVFFYVHTHVLSSASNNGFRSMLPLSPADEEGKHIRVRNVAQESAPLNVILHTIYNMSCAQYAPSMETIAVAVNHLPRYGIPLETCIRPSTPLYDLLLSQAPLYPLEVYSLAGQYDLIELATSVSSYLLSIRLSTLTDEYAELMGAKYLRRLFFLHLGRVDALKRLLFTPPHTHAPTKRCDYNQQEKLERAWVLAATYLTWDARPDMPVASIEAALRPLGDHLECYLCQYNLKERIKDLNMQWMLVKMYD